MPNGTTMNSASVRIDFPVLGIGGHDIFCYPTSERLHSWNAKALENGFHQGLELVDASGQHFTVKGAHQVARLPISPIWKLLLEPRPIRVSLDLEQNSPLSLSELKGIVARWLDEESSIWDSDRMKERVMAARSFEGVIAALT